MTLAPDDLPEELVERCARAVFEEWHKYDKDARWLDRTKHFQDGWKVGARAVLLAERAWMRERGLHDIRIIFDGPPGPEAGRFVEVENSAGKSICAGTWRQRDDGYWELRLTLSAAPPAQGRKT